MKPGRHSRPSAAYSGRARKRLEEGEPGRQRLWGCQAGRYDAGWHKQAEERVREHQQRIQDELERLRRLGLKRDQL